MSIYDELGLKTIVNASDTYTKLGGSRMSERVLEAMAGAARHFVNLGELAEAVCGRIASMTHNEAAFISSGCSACMVLASAVLMTGGDDALAERLPDASGCPKNELVVFAPQTMIPELPYWHLLELSGATLVKAAPTIAGLKAAIGERCAGVWVFDGSLYDQELPPLGEVIAAGHEMGVPVLVDAAAQLPPVSNLWRYTVELGADGAVFSGGKFIMGPQSTGLFVGRAEIAQACYALSNPNVRIGRPYKVGKEEYAALYAALTELVAADAGQVKVQQNRYLDIVEQGLADCEGIRLTRLAHGRIGQDAPRLLIRLPEGKSGKACADFLYSACNPAVDIGYFPPKEQAGVDREVFVNSINLRENESEYIVDCLRRYLQG